MSKINKVFPTAYLILGYEHFFDNPYLGDRETLLKGICKRQLLYELIGINYRLKPSTSLGFNTGKQLQQDLLHYILDDDESIIKKANEKIDKVVLKYTKFNDNFKWGIFTRAGVTLAIEEILNNEEQKITDKELTNQDMFNLFKYILLCNNEVTDACVIAYEDYSLEDLNSKMLALNELMIETDAPNTFIKADILFNYLLNNDKIKIPFTNYFETNYKLHPHGFLASIIASYMPPPNTPEEVQFYTKVVGKVPRYLKTLSKRYQQNQNHKLLNIRKGPIYRDKDNQFLLMDNNCLVDKVYKQLIMDFWFDDLKNKNLVSFAEYKSIIGHFVHHYCYDIFKYSFRNYKGAILKCGSELEYKSNKGNKELCDIYLRYNKRIMLCEIKSNTIYDDAKYGKSLEALYNGDRSRFFKNFGLNQLINAIKNLNELANIDPSFNINKNLIIYPIIIFDDKTLNTPLMSYVFNKRFLELISGIELQKHIKIKKLSLCSVNDWELLKYSFKKPNKIWSILEQHTKNKQFLQPFYDTLSKLKLNRIYKQNIDRLKEIMKEYQHYMPTLKRQ